MRDLEFIVTDQKDFNYRQELVIHCLWWTKIFIGHRGYFVYGPFLNRLYLLNHKESLDDFMHSLLGLKKFTYKESLADPALEVIHQSDSLCKAITPQSRRIFLLYYKVLFLVGKVLPVLWLVRCIELLARVRKTRFKISLAEIGQAVWSVEKTLHFSSCYPRALLTAFLCIKHGHPCDLVIGCLCPTKQMHAWCSSGGKIPYELKTEHYLYQPLIIINFSTL